MNALIFLIETFARLYILAFLLRLLLQIARADFHNPIAQFIVEITNPIIVPARRIVPGMRRFDLPTLVVIVLLQLVVVVLVSTLRGFVPRPDLLVWAVIFSLLEMVIWTYLIGILIHVVLSWIGRAQFYPIGSFIEELVEPVLRPVRRRLPATSGIDLSPLIVGIFLWAALILLADLQRTLI